MTNRNAGTQDPGTLVDGSFEIGRRNYASGYYYYTGSIDDARVYNRVLSASEIMQLYKMGVAKVAKTPTPAAGSNSLKTGLVGWWTFDGADVTTNTTTDKSGNGNNGARGVGTTVATGKLGQAMKFNGSTESILVTDSPSLSITDKITISAWAKWTTGGSDSDAYLLSKGTDKYNFLIYAVDAGKMTFLISALSPSTTLKTVGAYNNNKWHLFTGTYDPNGGTNNIKIYVDGVLENQATKTGSPSDDANGLGIGRYGTGGNYRWNGSIDDARVYNRVLTAAEVMQLYKMGVAKVAKTPTPSAGSNSLKTGLVGWWTMDGRDTTATAVNDKSGSGNNGTRTGGKVASGKLGQAIKFNGSTEYITTVDSPFDFGTGNFTAAAWFKVSTQAEANAILDKYGAGGAGDKGWILWANSTGNNKLLGFIDNGSVDMTGATSLVVGRWYHAALVRNGDIGYLYLNGVQDASLGGLAARNAVSNVAMQIGSENGSATYAFNGSIDDARVYNRALSASEIMQLYKMGR
ncbi:hypothetical protein EPN28_02785 [Patescibacteria group bacterium]|nr:MAG: hypothetical protein EPN28_02785 [Patescibacteria group bacterium]